MLLCRPLCTTDVLQLRCMPLVCHQNAVQGPNISRCQSHCNIPQPSCPQGHVRFPGVLFSLDVLCRFEGAAETQLPQQAGTGSSLHAFNFLCALGRLMLGRSYKHLAASNIQSFFRILRRRAAARGTHVMRAVSSSDEEPPRPPSVELSGQDLLPFMGARCRGTFAADSTGRLSRCSGSLPSTLSPASATGTAIRRVSGFLQRPGDTAQVLPSSRD